MMIVMYVDDAASEKGYQKILDIPAAYDESPMGREAADILHRLEGVCAQYGGGFLQAGVDVVTVATTGWGGDAIRAMGGHIHPMVGALPDARPVTMTAPLERPIDFAARLEEMFGQVARAAVAAEKETPPLKRYAVAPALTFQPRPIGFGDREIEALDEAAITEQTEALARALALDELEQHGGEVTGISRACVMIETTPEGVFAIRERSDVQELIEIPVAPPAPAAQRFDLD